MTIKDYIQECHKTAREKGFYDKERNAGEAIALIISELMEALEGHRKGNIDNVAEEIADTFIRIFDWCGGFKVCSKCLENDTLENLLKGIDKKEMCDIISDEVIERGNFGEFLLYPMHALLDIFAAYNNASHEDREEWRNDWLEDCEESIMDTIILLLCICKKFNISIVAAIDKKMSFNKTRPYLHGKTY